MPIKNTEKFNDEPDAWAVLPFDEAEDDARWSRLLEETSRLTEEAEEIEAVHGQILTENKLSGLRRKENQPKDELF